jgi:hypothetical protein
MTDHYVGDLVAYRRDDGSVRLALTNPGPLRVTRGVVEQAEPEWVSRTEDLLTFHGVDDDGAHQAYRYRIVGEEHGDIEGGWLLCEPLP